MKVGAGGLMLGRSRTVEILAVVLIAVVVAASVAVLEREANHAVPRYCENSLGASERGLGLVLPSVRERQTVSLPPLIAAAFSPVLADELTSPNAQTGGSVR